jgi:hypothetical protein
MHDAMDVVMSFSPMKEGAEKVLTLLLLVSLQSVKGFYAANVYGFRYITARDCNSPNLVNLCNSEWSLCKSVHLWLTVAFICIEGNKNLVSWCILLCKA